MHAKRLEGIHPAAADLVEETDDLPVLIMTQNDELAEPTGDLISGETGDLEVVTGDIEMEQNPVGDWREFTYVPPAVASVQADIEAEVDKRGGVLRYRAKFPNGNPVFVKEVDPKRGGDREMLARGLSIEAAISAKVRRKVMETFAGTGLERLIADCPPVAVTSQITEGIYSKIVFNYLLGQNLQDKLDMYAEENGSRKIAWPDIYDFLLKVVHPLKVAHDADIVHCDLKPANLFYVKDESTGEDEDESTGEDEDESTGEDEDKMRVYLLDWGIAKHKGSLPPAMAEMGTIAGTFAYMAPEQFSSDKVSEIDHRADIYALGVILYEMIVGKKPFPSDGEVGSLIWAKTHKTFEKLEYSDDIPDELVDIVNQCLEPKPEDRPQDVMDILRALGLADGEVDDLSSVKQIHYENFFRRMRGEREIEIVLGGVEEL